MTKKITEKERARRVFAKLWKIPEFRQMIEAYERAEKRDKAQEKKKTKK